MKSRVRFGSLVVASLLAAAFCAAAQSAAPVAVEKVAKLVYQPGALSWDPQIAYRSAALRVVGPGGFVHEREFSAAKPFFDLASQPGLGDGQYTFELVFGRKPDPALAKAISEADMDEDGTIFDRGLGSRIDGLREVVSGSFRVQDGKIVSPYAVEPRSTLRASSKDFVAGAKDVVTADDMIVQGSLCAGLDCVVNEAFGFDTIRLKENNTRLQFTDTSIGAFASNNWQIRANSSLSGGPNFLAFVDQGADGNSETGTIVFSVEGGAPPNALIVNSSGKVGIRTATPLLDIHARTGNTPAIRLEQDGTGGFTPQTWDIGANEANFFVRDLTGSNRLPFRIRPGAPTSSVDIGATGNVGIGTVGRATEPASPTLFLGRRFSIATSNVTGAQYVQLSNNAVYDGVTPTYVEDGPANQIYLNGGTTVFRRAVPGVAASPVSWAESLRIDPAGSVGVGAAPVPVEPSSPHLFVGSRFSIGTSASTGPQYVQLSNNAIYNGANPTYVGAGGASQIYMNGDVMVFRRAGSGNAGDVVPWSQAVRIDASGTRINGDLHVTGTCCGPDYVFDPSFKLASIEENAAYMWKNRHLAAVGPTRTNAEGRTEVNVFAQGKGMLEEIEKAHIYIEQLHSEIKALKLEAQSREAEVRRELAEIRRQLGR